MTAVFLRFRAPFAIVRFPYATVLIRLGPPDLNRIFSLSTPSSKVYVLIEPSPGHLSISSEDRWLVAVINNQSGIILFEFQAVFWPIVFFVITHGYLVTV